MSGKPISVRESSGYLVSDEPEKRPRRPSRRISADDQEWIVRVAGAGVSGAGPVYAVRFFRSDQPDTPVRELLTGSLDLEALHPNELQKLFARSKRLDPAD